MTSTPTLEDLGIHMAAIVRPGDTVVFACGNRITREQADYACELWDARVPDVKAVFISAAEMAIIRRISEDNQAARE
jgi:hypothetical protein